MAVVKWKTPAYRLFNEYVESALLEYGKKTAERWLSDAATIYDRLQKFPESYSPEPLLRDRKRFRLVYYYNPHTDIVRIVDIWDTRMNPETLIMRI